MTTSQTRGSTLTTSMLIGSLLQDAPTYTMRKNALTGLRRFAAKHGIDVALLEITGTEPKLTFRLKPEPHPLDLPEEIKVENRVPLTPAQERHLQEVLARQPNKDRAPKAKPAPVKRAAPAKRATSGEAASKRDAVVKMIRARWTPMADIIKETGWLPHTARAFLCRIKDDAGKKIVVESKREDGVTSYRVAG